MCCKPNSPAGERYNVAMPSERSDSVIQAAGGVLLRSAPSGDELMIVHRKRYGDWTLPKGKLKPDESFVEAAVREVAEETGCSCQLGDYLGAIGYQVKGVPKVVLFWRMSVIEEKGLDDHEEVYEALWLPVGAAIDRLTHAQEREFLLKPLFCSRSYGPVANLQLPDIGRRARWFRRTREAARLSREFQVFRVELAFLEQRSQTPAKAWVQAAKDHLANVERCLKSKRFRSNDIEEA